MAQESQVSYKQSKPLSKNDFERIQKLLAEMEERQEKISIVPLTKDSTRRKLSRSSGSSVVVNWADKVPLCQRSCRPDRIGTFGGAGRRKWLDTDKRIKIE